MKKILVLLIFSPFVLRAQQDTTGIKFVNGFSWQMIRDKAKSENKYIFLDVMASWCGPCKMMDKEVYSNDSVALFMNEKFISVKVQMDSSNADNDQVKSWYADAHLINQEFHVQGYPSLLFFNPDGTLVYRKLGFQDPQTFLRSAANAFDPRNLTYLTKLREYNAGKKDYVSMAELAIYVKDIDGNEFLAKSVAKDYFEYYLCKLTGDKLCTKDNLNFISIFDLGNSSGNVFHLCYTKPAIVDSLIGFNGWAKNYVQSRITREELENKLKKNGKALFRNPDWNHFTVTIKEKYPLIDAGSLVDGYRIFYYRSISDWGNWFYYKNRNVEKGQFGRMGNLIGFDLNDMGGWDAFLHCNDKNVLRRVIPWVSLAIKEDGPLDGPIWGYLDTKANLLYKIGEKDSALYFEKMVIDWCEAFGKNHHNELVLQSVKEFQTTLAKMERDEPTYLDQGALWDRSTLPGKPVLDTSAFYHWPALCDNAVIAGDGNYAGYFFCDHGSPETLVIRNVKTNWKEAFEGANSLSFTKDGKNALFMLSNDTLCIQALPTSRIEKIPDVSAYQLICTADDQWLLFRKNDAGRELILRSAITGYERRFNHVTDYVFWQKYQTLLLQTDTLETAGRSFLLQSVDLQKNQTKIIWKGDSVSNVVCDSSGKQITFTLPHDLQKSIATKEGAKDIWYFDQGMERAKLLLSSENLKTPPGYEIDHVQRFTTNDSCIVVTLKYKESLPDHPLNTNVNIWSYRDAVLQSQQLEQMKYDKEKYYTAIVSVQDGTIRYLQNPDEVISIAAVYTKNGNDDFIIIDRRKGDPYEEGWSQASQAANFVVSLKTGARHAIDFDFNFMGISPDGRYILGRKYPEQDIVAYDLLSGQTENITNAIPIPTEMDDHSFRQTKMFFGFTPWIDDSHPLLIVYDKYDIWKIDLSDLHAPVCLTNGYGRKNGIQFRFIATTLPGTRRFDEFLHLDDKFLLTGFNLSTQSQGFYVIPEESEKDPEMLSEGPYIYMPDFAEITPIKAAGTNVYLVKRRDAKDAPNYFTTTDFRHFDPLTDFYPEKKYNWFYTELMDFSSLNGNKSKAIVYKPDNFDPSHQYPVILHYYEKRTNKLNENLTIFDKEGMDFSVAWFVSHGYIVVSPDIYYSIRHRGEDALNAILGVTKALETYPWVDARHIGLQGESFGGFETNYIVTHSNRFAAAISSSGTVDEMLEYNFLWGNLGPAKQCYEEHDQGRMVATPWERPAAYIENSSIFHVDRLKTPMLIVANTMDGNVSFRQGLSLYLAMRRLGKVGWMLQYDNATHGLGETPEFIDYTIRSQQFFDYYLKDSAAPRWMVEGISARKKNIESGFELEPKGIHPGPGLPTTEEQQKMNLWEHKEPAVLVLPWTKK